MDLVRYVEELRRQLLVAAEAGGEEARALAERLTAPLESSVRLVLLDALSTAAGEITRELAPGSVDVRLRGGEPELVVTAPPDDQPARSTAEPGDTAAVDAPPPVADGDEGGTARITLRLPEQLKARIEQAAGREGLSVNAWLVRAASAALAPEPPRRPPRPAPGTGQRITGWAR